MAKKGGNSRANSYKLCITPTLSDHTWFFYANVVAFYKFKWVGAPNVKATLLQIVIAPFWTESVQQQIRVPVDQLNFNFANRLRLTDICKSTQCSRPCFWNTSEDCAGTELPESHKKGPLEKYGQNLKLCLQLSAIVNLSGNSFWTISWVCGEATDITEVCLDSSLNWVTASIKDCALMMTRFARYWNVRLANFLTLDTDDTFWYLLG